LAVELDHAHPGAASSLREGMQETLTLTRLGIEGKLKLTPQSTNPCESMISTVRVIHRNVKNWSSGDTCLRWTATGMLEPRPASARSRATEASPTSPSRSNTTSFDTATRPAKPRSRRTPRLSLCNHHTRTAVTSKFHDGRGNLNPCCSYVAKR
jgi:hypothetical protein